MTQANQAYRLFTPPYGERESTIERIARLAANEAAGTDHEQGAPLPGNQELAQRIAAAGRAALEQHNRTCDSSYKVAGADIATFGKQYANKYLRSYKAYRAHLEAIGG